ncbi:hypothetical protein [Larkinella rosea]|uniref:Uncharacterized protein n=1 Tax=Larkinella rosea TaxID=2025312 RepID=A0A3P1C0S4_9BACT|nr:hypothetical protein [Larkinella rosea]RRB06862.1 hypothetical protein EHT25_03480 [Larkinella rosea]
MGNTSLKDFSEKVYITNANYKRMLKKFDLKNLPQLQGDIYKKPIYFFSKLEKNILLAIQDLLRDPENFIGMYYTSVKRPDTYTYVYEGGRPAYHRDLVCPNLHSNFKNFEIPVEIKDKGIQEITRFRKWFHIHKEIFETDLKRFTELLEASFFIIINPATIEQKNSGIEKIRNYDLEELEIEIDDLLKKAGRFYYFTEKITIILKRFSTLTFLAYKTDPIINNDTGYSDDEVREVLKQYDREFKKPLKELLIEYYKVSLNPNLSFSGLLLDRLDFKSCSICENGLSNVDI